MVQDDTGKTPLTGAEYDVATLALLGGHLALDFVNTIENRVGPDPDDTLRTPGDLRRWGTRLGLLRTTGVVGASRAEVDAARELREHLLGLLDAVTAHRRPPAGVLPALAAAVADAYAHGRLTASDQGALTWSWDRGALATVRRVVATSAVELFTEPQVHRIRRCDGPVCGWYFLDTSKNASRRWCSMRGCGNQVKALRRSHRSRGEA